MSSIYEELESLKGKMESEAISQPQTPPTESVEQSAVSTPVIPQQTPEGGEPKPTEEKVTPEVEPTAQKVEEDKTKEQDKTPKEVEVIDDWDSEPSSEPKEQPSVDIYSDLGKAVGLDKVKTKEDLINGIGELKEKLNALNEKQNSVFSDLPENLAKAVELAKNNGDYLTYLGLSTVDYEKIDPVDLYEAYVEDSLTDSAGNVDYEKVDEFLDSLSDTDKEIRGKQLKATYVSEQNQKKAYLEAQATEQKARKESAIREALDKLDAVNGFKVSPAHKQDIYQDLVSDPLKDYRKNGSLDYNKLARDRFIIKNYEKLDRFRQTQIKNATKREILDEITSPQIVRTGTVAAPEQTKKGYSLSDLLNDVSKVK